MSTATTTPAGTTAWAKGRLDAREGASEVLFGRMYEDCAIELAAFPPGGRVFCIASAGCTAMKLALRHQVVAVDLNPTQLAYARARIAGAPAVNGAAERFMALGRAFAPLVGWRRGRVRTFLDLDDPAAQAAYWRRHLDTRRFRLAIDAALSKRMLGAFYDPGLIGFLPSRLGPALRARMERSFARHPNRTNPYAHALLAGTMPDEPPPREARDIDLVEADAVSYLERQPAGSLTGLTLSNILDGADAAYGRRLVAAVKRAAAPGAMVVLRSFAEPAAWSRTDHADDDRAMLWGTVDVREATAL